jgi:broad specificity phosphatase PhoE
MAKQVELRRHTDSEGDALTAAGVAAALKIGQQLSGGYRLVASSGAQRATQTAACLIAGLGEQVPGGVVIEEGLRSHRENEWRAAYRKVGKGDLASLRQTDPGLVDQDSAALAKGLRRLLERLEDGERALAVGHSPTFEAAIFGLTGKILSPLGKGEGVLLIQDGDTYTVEPLSRGQTG